jgi:N-formylglutamate amidohydrolase
VLVSIIHISGPNSCDKAKGFWTHKHPKFLYLTLLLTLFHPFNRSVAQPTYTPGQVYYGLNNYTEYIAGNLPLIITAPHGGTDSASAIPNRTYGTTSTDLNTTELSRAIRTACFNRFGRWPHVIICRVPRTKIDCNREIGEGAQGVAATEAVWNEYHNLIRMAKDAVTSSYGRGLLIDIHGHGHTLQRLEVGYNLSTATLNKNSFYSSDKNSSCVRELANRTRVSFEELIRGSYSLGTLLDSRGYPSVPSLALPNPGKDTSGADNDYFSGGYTVETYGTMSPNTGTINAIQIESNYTGVRDTSSNRAAFAADLTDALDFYFPIHVGMNLNTLAPPPLISRFSDTTINEDNSTSPLTFTLSDPNSTVAATSSNSSLLSSTGVSFGGSGANRTLTITPQANAFGSNAMVTVAATSSDGGIGVEWFYLTVNPVNDAPIFSPVADRTINPGVSLTIPASATDVEGTSLGYALASGPAGCSVNPATGTFSWRPTIAQSGFTYPVAIRATESGTGGLNSTLNFQTTVNPATAPQISTSWTPGDGQSSPQVQLSMNGQLGPDYLVWASEDLLNWINLGTATPTTFPFVWTDANASQYPKRFYQIRLGP